MTSKQTQDHSSPSPAEQDAYLTAQLAVDALVDLPAPDGRRIGQDVGHTAQWLLFGRNWWRILCSGSWFLVRPYMREHLEFHRDTSLSLTDCAAQMQHILTQLQGLDDTELAAAAGAMAAARDAALLKAEEADASPESSLLSDEPATVWSADAAGLAVEVHAHRVAISALRDGLPKMPWWEPNGPNDKFLQVGIEYGICYRTGLARQIDAEEGETAAKTIANPPLTAEEALAGLDRVHRVLAEMTPRHRTIAFAAIDWAWQHATPLSA